MYPVQRREGGACGNEERVEEMSSVVGLDDGGDDDEEQELLLLLVGAIVRKVAESREPNQGNGEREAGREGKGQIPSSCCCFLLLSLSPTVSLSLSLSVGSCQRRHCPAGNWGVASVPGDFWA